MKHFSLLVSIVALALGLHAADPAASPPLAEIKLQTGEVLKNVRVLSQTPTHLTVKVGTVMRQLDKRQLPDDLQKIYPYDGDAAERRKAALAEAEAKRATDQAIKKAAKTAPPEVPGATGVAFTRVEKKGVRISFTSDPDGAGVIVALENKSNADQRFDKAEISARMVDDKTLPLRILVNAEDKLERGGKMRMLGDGVTVPAYGRLEFRGYFLRNYQEKKHNVMEVFWTPAQ